MSNGISQVVDLWKKEFSFYIKEYQPCKVSQQLKQIGSFFSPGLFYYYVLNFQNLKIEYVDPAIHNVLGIDPCQFTVENALKMLPADEIKIMAKKEALVANFLTSFLHPDQIMNYKVVYYLRILDTSDNILTLLHQATITKVSESGKVEHVLGIHTDVSHLNLPYNNKVSFINIKNGPSYFNLDPEDIIFNPSNSSLENSYISSLSKREIEVLCLVSQGLTAKQIAEQLYVSKHTIRTHRQNILLKSNLPNMTAVVAKCMAEGII